MAVSLCVQYLYNIGEGAGGSRDRGRKGALLRFSPRRRGGVGGVLKTRKRVSCKYKRKSKMENRWRCTLWFMVFLSESFFSGRKLCYIRAVFFNINYYGAARIKRVKYCRSFQRVRIGFRKRKFRLYCSYRQKTLAP